MGKIASFVTGLVLAGASIPPQVPAVDGASSPVNVKVPAALIAKANDPKPPANATQKTSIGKGKTAANTSNGAGDNDSFWVEQIDVDGDGNVEAAALLWDDEDKVLLIYAENDSLVCADGAPATADLLIAINGEGNARNRPAGSGFYVVSLDATECKVGVAEAYGCRFGAMGNPIACGVVEVDDKNDDIIIATASK
ncbi:MAG: hypothetical protein ABW298_01430 [Candidatus Binatia bacterium]